MSSGVDEKHGQEREPKGGAQAAGWDLACRRVLLRVLPSRQPTGG